MKEYNIGQVAKFLGLSRDTIKYYEKNGLVKPLKNESGYRKYNLYDIYYLVTINYYREIDMEIKKIQEILDGQSIEGIKSMLYEKEELIISEIEHRKIVLKRIGIIKDNCEKVEKYLGKFTIKKMPTLKIKGELSNAAAFDEYDVFHQNASVDKKRVTLDNLIRVIKFDSNGIQSDNSVLVTDDFDSDADDRVIKHPKCIYTVIETGRYLYGEANVDKQVENLIRNYAMENGFQLEGTTYTSIILTAFEENLDRVFVEIYTPIL